MDVHPCAYNNRIIHDAIIVARIILIIGILIFIYDNDKDRNLIPCWYPLQWKAQPVKNPREQLHTRTGHQA